MKRGGLERKTPLKRSGPPKRSKGLGRGNARPMRQRGVMRHETRAAALKRDGGRCRCGCGRRATQVHHIFKRERWPQLADVLDNLVSVAPDCHMRHESAFKRLPRHVVLDQAERVIAGCRAAGEYTPRMRSYFRRAYPA